MRDNVCACMLHAEPQPLAPDMNWGNFSSASLAGWGRICVTCMPDLHDLTDMASFSVMFLPCKLSTEYFALSMVEIMAATESTS